MEPKRNITSEISKKVYSNESFGGERLNPNNNSAHSNNDPRKGNAVLAKDNLGIKEFAKEGEFKKEGHVDPNTNEEKSEKTEYAIAKFDFTAQKVLIIRSFYFIIKNTRKKTEK